MPRSTGSSIERAIQFVREGDLDVVEIFLTKAKSIHATRTAEAKRVARAPQRKAGVGQTAAAPVAKRTRRSRAKRPAGNGAASSPAGTDSAATSGTSATPGSLTMAEQERNFSEATS